MSEPTKPKADRGAVNAAWAGAGLWDFAISIYGREPVRNICLALQDALGADVNLILYCLWLGVTGRGHLDSDNFAHLSEAVSVWQKDVVKPLRAARIRLRKPPAAVAPSAAGALRERIKEVELAAERIELDVLAESHERSPVALDPERRRRDMANSLAAYLDFIGAPASEDRASAIEGLVEECAES